MLKWFKNWLKESYQRFETARWNAGLSLARKYFPDSHFVIEKAFTIAGVDYFQFSSFADIPGGRGFWTGAFWNEYQMRCTLEYLLKHCEVTDKILKNKKEINIYELKLLNDQLKERLEMNFDVDCMYKLASVTFFDKNESPINYDVKYNRKKIEFWKKHAKVEDFFLSEPLLNHLNFLKQFDTYLESYLTLMNELNTLHLEYLSQLYSKNTLTDSTVGKK